MAYAVVRSKKVFLLLLIHCLFACIVCMGSVSIGPCFVMQYLVSFLVLKSIVIIVIVFIMSSDCY